MPNYFADKYVELQDGSFYIIKDILFSLLTVLLFRDTDFKSAKSLGISALHFVCVYAAQLGVSALYYMTGTDFYQIFIPSLLVLAVYVAVFCKYSITSRVIMSFAYFLFFYSSGNTAHLISALFIESGAVASGSVAVEVIYDLFAVAMICALSYYVMRFSIRPFGTPPKYYVIMQFLYFIIILFLPAFAEKGKTYENLIVNVALMSIDVLAYYMFYAVSKHHCSELENGLMLAQKEAVLAQKELSERNYETLKKLRHDIKNRYAYMGRLIEDRQYDKLEAYFADMEGQLFDVVKYVECGNYTVATTVNMEIGKATARGVKVEPRIAVPEKLPIADVDICSLLTNLMDNAIEACEREDTKDIPVSLKIALWNNTLTVEVKNAVKDADCGNADFLATTKKDGEFHGIGVKIIKEIAVRYGGCADFTRDNGFFVACVTLVLPLDKKENV